MASRALVLHKKESTTAGGLTSKKLTVSKSSGEIVSKAKAKQGKESTWAIDTRLCRDKDLKLTGMVLFNVGKDGKALYACVKDRQAKRIS
jgi:ribose 1,5-bisphosphokinase PhnN